MLEQIKQDLESIYHNNPKRLKHIYGVYETAIKLATIHGVDQDKVKLAALLHDITKSKPLSYHQEKILSCYNESVLTTYTEPLLHAFSAACVAKEHYNIRDESIIQAIESHTLGRPNMSMIEKIIFISDYIEPNRPYASCKRVRPIAFKDIDLAIYEAVNDSIKLYEAKGHKIPKIAYQTRDYYNPTGGTYGKNSSH